MRKLIFTLSILFAFLLIGNSSMALPALGSSYKVEKRQELNQNTKQIKKLFELHQKYANAHDIKGLKTLYSDGFMNNDGFDKTTYFKSVGEALDSCKDLTYNTKINSININGNYATVSVEETGVGTVKTDFNGYNIGGELHSISRSIYHLTKVNNRWFISGETDLDDESSLIYGDVKFMELDVAAPAQVSAGDEYSASVELNSKDNIYVIGSITQDPVKYPSDTPKFDLKAFSQDQTLERVFKANQNGQNEYVVVSFVVSKIVGVSNDKARMELSGWATIMKRVNVVTKNKFIQIEE